MKLGNLTGLAKAMFAGGGGGGGGGKSTVGDLELDAILERTTELNSEVTDYPVEDGFPVADHVTRQPLTLSMTCVCTPTPLDGSGGLYAAARGGGGSVGSGLQSTADKLLAIYQAGKPIKVTTPDAIYEDMIMLTAPLPRTVEDGICYKLALEFKHVRIVAQETAEVGSEAQGSAGKSEMAAGAAYQKEIGTGMTTIDNQPFIQMDSTAAGLAVAGTITTGALNTAAMAAYSAYQSMAGLPIPTVGGGFGGGISGGIGGSIFGGNTDDGFAAPVIGGGFGGGLGL